MRSPYLALVLVTAALPAAQAQTVPPPAWDESGARTIATIEGKRIVVADVEEGLLAQRRRDVAAHRTDAFLSSARDRVLEELIDVKLLAVEARSRGVSERPEVRRRVEALVDSLLAAALAADESRAAALDESALRNYYLAHPAEFSAGERVRARHIVVKTQEEAERVLRDLRTGGDFEALARSRNVDSTRQTGGDLGWVTRGVMVPEFERVLFASKVGEVSPVVRTMFGFHLAKVEEVDAGKAKPFESVSAEIRQKLLEAHLEGFKASLRTRYRVVVDREALESVGR